jgi:pimeloyl-ACP methyl ester carboxylesterase
VEYFWAEPRFARFLRRLASFSRLILFDKRGTGLSDRVPIGQLPTIEQRMFDLRAVMDAVGSEKAAICGISEGGPMSAVFAATWPERTAALVMIGSYARRLKDEHYPWGPTLEEREKYIAEIRDHWGGPIGIEERAPSLAADPDFRRWWAAYLRMGASPNAAAALTRMNAEIDVRRILPAIRVPTLVLHRRGDRCLKVEEGRFLAGIIPGARFVELPGEDHLPFVGDQEAILNEIEQFLARTAGAAEHETVLAAVAALDAGIEAGEPALQSHVKTWRGRLAASPQGMLAIFDGPERAVRCAAALARDLECRAGVHIGECERAGTAGPAVEMALSVRDRARPGEVVVSNTVRDLVAGSGLRFDPHGAILVASEEYDLRLWCITES